MDARQLMAQLGAIHATARAVADQVAALMAQVEPLLAPPPKRDDESPPTLGSRKREATHDD